MVPKCYKPGVAVGLDLFFIPDLENKKSLPVLNMVDLGTNFQMIELVESKEPKVLWNAFWRTWCRTFGMPQYLSVDEGLEFRGNFTQWCADFGTIMFRAAGRSPWQQGRVERHGGLIKEMITKARETASLESVEELRLLLNECEGSKNRFMNRSGYSPVQRQLGQWPRLPGSLMSDEVLDPALQTQDTTDEFDRLLTLRKLAQEAFMKLSCQRAADKALKARPRLQRVFKAGDLVYVYRVLRQKKKVHGAAYTARGTGLGRKAAWVGPGHVLAMEGSVVWINMFGELWRASVEQTREATTNERLGLEMVSEEFDEMQERLKRSSHRAGYRDVTADHPEEEALEDEVEKEGAERGRPRVRFQEGDDELCSPPTPLPDPPEEIQSPEPLFDSSPSASEAASVGQRDEMNQQRRVSEMTVPEPDGEAPSDLVFPNLHDEQQELNSRANEVARSSMVDSVVQNNILDGLPPAYGRATSAVHSRWRRRTEDPYFAEFFFTGETEVLEQDLKEPTQDYWVYDSCRQVLQRHHVQWRRNLFNPMQVNERPVPLRALKKSRKTQRMTAEGVAEVCDEWSMFSKREEKFGWWKGITEFPVDAHFLNEGPKHAGKKRGEGEVFSHEIPEEEWPEWHKQDLEEFNKIVQSGALRILSPEESKQVREQLKAEGKSDRILPSRMVRRYKPGDSPGAPRTKKSRFCIRGDRDPDAIFLSRFAPTVTTSNLQILFQAAMNKGFGGVVGDLKSAFTQSLPLVRAGGKLYCKSCDGSMPGLDPDQLAEIVLGCYGLCDAPMHWRKTLVSYLTQELKYRQSALDPCTFLLHGPREGDKECKGEDDWVLHGMVAVEIDDLLMFGDAVHDEKMKKLQQKFTFGKIEKIDEKGVNFNGRRLKRKGDTLFVDMKAFVEERMETIELDKERAKLKSAPLTEEEVSLVRRACGSLNWAGREGRPDASAAASMFSSIMKEMKIGDIAELNQVILRLKETSDLALQIQAIPEERMKWGVVTDASYANARGGKTQGGHLLLAFDRELLEGKSAICNVLHWKSGKLPRTVNSTLAAETQSLARGIGDLLWMMVMYAEVVDPCFQLRNWRRHVNSLGYTAFTKHEDEDEMIGAIAVVDAKSLFDILANETNGGTDRRTALDVQMLREELDELRGKIRWIDHVHMPADCLTKKRGRVDQLVSMLQTGRFGITAESVTLDSRMQDRAQHGYNRR